MKYIHTLLFLSIASLVTGSTLYVVNKCPSKQPVVFRGAYGVEIYNGTINSGATWSDAVNPTNCQSCNIGINAGSTLLAEFSHQGTTIWWDLSTDAGYNYPPFLMYTTDPSSPHMYCGDPKCPDGTPGDSHIENSPGQYDIYVIYCGPSP